MAAINTDIAQKVDINARQFDSFTLTLNLSTITSGVYDLTSTYVIMSVYNIETENSILIYTNASNSSGTMHTYFTQNNITMYDRFKVDEYTIEQNTGIAVNTQDGTLILNDYSLKIAPGNYEYKLVTQTITNIKTWMYGKFKVVE
tara:strand:- start:172 stop:606 length:435 start_codon:yes stop_codon:yes gene_type:complete